MRRYTSDHISIILKEKCDELELYNMAKMHQQLKEQWKHIPDPRLRTIAIDFFITKERKLIIECPSSVLLNYVRRQSPLISNHLATFVSEFEITSIEITLGDKSSSIKS